ncbi:MAG: hypothetical protein CPDRYMAC_4181 [uncultured Paraburkholderia sp.]|nr:MAG: hypothetical protein CPDRYDRY_4029 [uncultured Paraburkholderia sp.]CAH2935299.1 MAG: hypothetical protein CPDRYMAC_4181 [uncultured Paraburkholderia sp.]
MNPVGSTPDARASAMSLPVPAGFEFVEREGFCHVVVGTEIEAFHAFVDAVGGGED